MLARSGWTEILPCPTARTKGGRVVDDCAYAEIRQSVSAKAIANFMVPPISGASIRFANGTSRRLVVLRVAGRTSAPRATIPARHRDLRGPSPAILPPAHGRLSRRASAPPNKRRCDRFPAGVPVHVTSLRNRHVVRPSRKRTLAPPLPLDD